MAIAGLTNAAAPTATDAAAAARRSSRGSFLNILPPLGHGPVCRASCGGVTGQTCGGISGVNGPDDMESGPPLAAERGPCRVGTADLADIADITTDLGLIRSPQPTPTEGIT